MIIGKCIEDQSEMDEIIAKHRLWQKDHSTGCQADFRECYIEGVSIYECNLTDALLAGSYWTNVEFVRIIPAIINENHVVATNNKNVIVFKSGDFA